MSVPFIGWNFAGDFLLFVLGKHFVIALLLVLHMIYYFFDLIFLSL